MVALENAGEDTRITLSLVVVVQGPHGHVRPGHVLGPLRTFFCREERLFA